jgi:hypothetical protein
MNVNPYIERAVVPVRMMLTAPVAVVIEPVDIAVDLSAVVSVFRGIVIDPRLIVLKAFVAIVIPVISTCCTGEWQSKADCQCSCQDEPHTMTFHVCSLHAYLDTRYRPASQSMKSLIRPGLLLYIGCNR